MMRDTSRPPKCQSTHCGLHEPTSSSLPGSRVPLSRGAMSRLDSDTFSQSQGSDYSSSGMHPWGDVKARGGRGDLIATGQTHCMQREITLALALISSSWATG